MPSHPYGRSLTRKYYHTFPTYAHTARSLPALTVYACLPLQG